MLLTLSSNDEYQSTIHTYSTPRDGSEGDVFATMSVSSLISDNVENAEEKTIYILFNSLLSYSSTSLIDYTVWSTRHTL